jgi:hypothetical protein
MAVLMTAHIPGATKEMIDGLRPLLGPIRTAKGFVVHTNGPVPGGWRVTEVWDFASRLRGVVRGFGQACIC